MAKNNRSTQADNIIFLTNALNFYMWNSKNSNKDIFVILISNLENDIY